METIEWEYEENCDILTDSDNYEKVIRASDYVVGILPKTPKTDGYFDLKKFKMMGPDTIFINIGTGSTLVEVILH